MNYAKKNDFVNTSYTTFEYKGDMVTRKNIHDTDGKIAQFSIYENDGKGNIVVEKYYSYDANGPEPELISETTYKYDDKNNPFKVFKASGNPGLFTNSNNITEVRGCHIITPQV